MSTTAWSSENELVDVFVRSLQSDAANTAHKKLKIFREFDPGVGRVDILCVWYNPNRLNARQMLISGDFSTPFSTLSGYAMALLKQCRWISMTTFEQRMRLAHYRAKKIVQQLSERGLVLVDGNYLRARSNSDIWFIDDIEAYEAKLAKWQAVIGQASQHEWFASQTFVVMPQPTARVKRHLVQQCADKGIGVVLYPDNKTSTVVVQPEKRKLPMTHVGWFLNERIFEEVSLNGEFRTHDSRDCVGFP